MTELTPHQQFLLDYYRLAPELAALPSLPPAQIQNMKGQTYYPLVVAAYELGFDAGIRHSNAGLKEQALTEVASAVAGGNITPERGQIITRALEQIDG